MTYRISIDPGLCSGFGSCVQIAPEAFRLEAGAATALIRETADPRVAEAARSCPMGAITVDALEQAA